MTGYNSGLLWTDAISLILGPPLILARRRSSQLVPQGYRPPTQMSGTGTPPYIPPEFQEYEYAPPVDPGSTFTY